MMLRTAVLSALAVVLAGAAWWVTPSLLELAGLDDFLFVGRLCVVVVALSLAESALGRLHA